MKLIVQKLAVEYQDEGNGPVLLFLHGWQDNLHSLDAVSKELVKQYRVIRVDLPGFGKSELPKEAWDLDHYIRFVSDFVQKLQLSVFAFIGHSFGGRITIKGIGTKQLQAERIILIGAAGLAKNKTLKTLAIKSVAKTMGLVSYIPPLLFWRKTLRTRLYRAIGSDYHNAGPLKATLVKVTGEDLAAFAQHITVPTLLIWGANDMATPVTDGRRYAQLILGSELKVIENSGHFVHQEQASLVSTMINQFLC